jgi:hypothetical protein
MPGSHWLDSGADSLSYSGAPRSMSSPSVGAAVKSPPALFGPSKPAAGAGQPSLKPPTAPKLQAPQIPPVAATAPAAAPTQPSAPAPQAPQIPPVADTAPSAPGLGERALGLADTGLNAYNAYALSRGAFQGVRSFGGQVAQHGLGTATANLGRGAAAQVATRALPAYGAYALADAALVTPYQLATGQADLEGAQQRGVHDSYLSNLGSNLMRPGRAAFSFAQGAGDTLVNAPSQLMRGRDLDARMQALQARRQADY